MQALGDIRILDLSKLVPGDYCGMLLADMGAEVIKLEDSKGDPLRYFEPRREGLSYWHQVFNRNKRSVSLDITTPEGKGSLLEMLKEADVLLESFRPGRMESLGLGYDVLSQINPKLVYCSISGFGAEGYKNMRGAHDINIVGLAGIRPDEKYQGEQMQIAGITAATHGALGIVAALHSRTITGKGQRVDVSMLRSTLSLLPAAFANYLGAKETGAKPYEKMKPNYRAYETKDGRWITVGAFESKFWNRLCELLDFIEGQELLKDPSKEDELTAKMEEIFAARTLKEWEALFENEDICVTPVHTLEEIIDGGILNETGMMKKLTDEKLGDYLQIGSPISFSYTPVQYRQRAPYLGEDNKEFLK